MTPYSFKTARKKQWCCGGWAEVGMGEGGHKQFWEGGEFFFLRDWGGVVKMFAHHMKIYTHPPPPPAPIPQLIINDSSLMDVHNIHEFLDYPSY